MKRQTSEKKQQLEESDVTQEVLTNSLAVDQWLKSVKQLSDKAKRAEKTIEKKGATFIVYRLFEESGRFGQINLYETKFGKSGNVNVGKPVKRKKIEKSKVPNTIMQPEDRPVLNIYQKIVKKNSYANLLEGSFGYILIKKIIETGRAYFRRESAALHFNEMPTRLPFSFKDSENDTVKLELDIDENMFLVYTEPMLLINRVDGTVTKLDCDISADIIKKLLDCPPIPKSRKSDLYVHLNRNLPSLRIDEPDTTEGILIKDVTPTVRIIISREDEELEGRNYASVSFGYNDEWLSSFPNEKSSTIFRDDIYTTIIRESEFEKEALNFVSAFGFTREELVSDYHFLSPHSVNSHDDLLFWKEILSQQQRFTSKGWEFIVDKNSSMKFVTGGTIEASSEEIHDWFTLSFTIELAGEKYPLVPIVASILERYEDLHRLPEMIFINLTGRAVLEIPSKTIRPILTTILHLYNGDSADNMIKVPAHDAHLIEDLNENITSDNAVSNAPLSDNVTGNEVIWRGSRRVLGVSKKLKDFKKIEAVTPATGLQATLREYQKNGVNWLNFMREYNFNGILADDMGLGKTIQTLAYLLTLKEQGLMDRPTLIIVPTSLLANWRNEVKKFTPSLSVLTLYGTGRGKLFSKIDKHDIVITTYNLVVNDVKKLVKKEFLYIILDEAQKIKNPKTKMSTSIKMLESKHRLALSGTPIENHLGELWSLYSFLMPSFFKSQKEFKEQYQNPIERDNDREVKTVLNRKIRPFMLRRTKELVADELPPKSEIIKYTQFGDKQAELYESIRIAMEKKIKDLISEQGVNRSHITILDALLKLRQVCCDPQIVKLQHDIENVHSAKLELLLDLLDELLQEDRKILIFSQFTSMLSIIENEIKSRNITYTKLTGATRKREEAIGKFTRGEASIFLISLKAGGVGLNLTEADTVIHYDPWWNPAVESQATDRAHRIGQNKKVFVYKLIVENSVEEKILMLQEQKRELQNSLYKEGSVDGSAPLNADDLLDLLKS